MSSRPTASLPDSYFDELYAQNPDPYHFATNPYEHEKYAATLEALPRPRYASALEIGCSIGVLTAMLAPRCDRLLSLDAAEAAVVQARSRVTDFPGAEVRTARVPEQWPQGRFDLILISEVLYYFGHDDLRRLAALTTEALQPGGDCVLVHWLPETDPAYPLVGDEAVNSFLQAAAGLQPVSDSRNDLYRLDVLRRPG
ncbi:class I SAM-dependent DNA methyltransferase [Roseomonas sp. BN140053]|uniref:class I SAM-dependent DNA methyltransferase n=1 Tax=Roseomonas sp. BN140053 TaxID=3391898 RepID=UPI0039E8B19F